MRFVYVWLVKRIDQGCPEEGIPGSEELVFVGDSESAAQQWVDNTTREFWTNCGYQIEQRWAITDGTNIALIDSVTTGVQSSGKRFEQPPKAAPSKRKKAK